MKKSVMKAVVGSVTVAMMGLAVPAFADLAGALKAAAGMGNQGGPIQRR